MRIFTFIFTLTLMAFSQSKAQSDIPNGIYYAKTGTIKTLGIDIYTYLRFYSDSSVYYQTITSSDAQAVSSWFGRYRKYSQKGSYSLSPAGISITLQNSGTIDAHLEGPKGIRYKGNMQQGQLCLKQIDSTAVVCFSPANVKDTTTIKYTDGQTLRLPGEWKIKQVLQYGGQIFFINKDSTLVAFMIHAVSDMPAQIPDAKTPFEAVLKYYKWDSDYMRDSLKMEERKLDENKEKVFVIWNARDRYNDNYFLFGNYNNTLYNLMVSDKAMTKQAITQFLEMLYDLNKK